MILWLLSCLAFADPGAGFPWSDGSIDDFQQMSITGSETHSRSKEDRALKASLKAIQAAHSELQALLAAHMHDPDPGFALSSLQALARINDHMADALIGSEAPFYLTDDQRSIYQEALADMAAAFREKADEAYQQGVDRALTDGHLCHQVVAAAGARDQRVHSLPPPTALFAHVTVPQGMHCSEASPVRQAWYLLLVGRYADGARRLGPQADPELQFVRVQAMRGAGDHLAALQISSALIGGSDGARWIPPVIAYYQTLDDAPKRAETITRRLRRNDETAVRLTLQWCDELQGRRTRAVHAPDPGPSTQQRAELETMMKRAMAAQARSEACNDPSMKELATLTFEQAEMIFEAQDASMAKDMSLFIEEIEATIAACDRG